MKSKLVKKILPVFLIMLGVLNVFLMVFDESIRQIQKDQAGEVAVLIRIILGVSLIFIGIVIFYKTK